MKNIIKKSTVILMTLIMISSFCLPCFANDITTAELYGYYADEMLFKQNDEAVFAGTASKNSVISCNLIDSDGTVVKKAESTANEDGTFSVSFIAPSGSYDEYSVLLFENGIKFAELENIVFGELWLASGQSNVELTLASSISGSKMLSQSQTGSKWLRFLSVPSFPEYEESANKLPLNPQSDIKGCKWFSGNSISIYSFSALGYFFAEKLQKTLGMPVGVIQSSLGGSSIISWLSREAVDSSEEVKSILTANNAYISAENWNESNQNAYLDMTANYNKKIAPLKNFRLSGMIWYQGESDLMLNVSGEDYCKQLDLLQQSYSKLFQFDGLLPLVFTQIASYGYSNDFKLQCFNIELSNFQNESPSSRGMTSIYDIALTYNAQTESIHPLEKEPVAERMAFCAEGLVYNLHGTYTAATVKEVKISSGEVLITFRNIGSGLISNGKTLKGFAVCGKDGIYFPAEAEIVAKNTIMVKNTSITEPVSVSYAVSQSNARSNLFAQIDDTLMPVSPFITDKNYTAHLWKDSGWTDCDSETIWRTDTNELAGFYNTWTSENSACEITAESAFSGDAGLSVKANEASFSISPVLKDKNGKILLDVENDLSDYKTLSFKIRNNGSSDVIFENLQISTACSVLTPLNSDGSISQTIPADGCWHTVTLDLTSLMSESGKVENNQDGSLLKSITDIKLSFSSAKSKSDISIDEFDFSTALESLSKEPNETTKKSFVERFRALINKIFEKIKAVFHIK